MLKQLLHSFFLRIQSYQRWLVLILLVLILSLTTAPAGATSLYEIPALEDDTWVLDVAEVISRTNEGNLRSTLADLAKRTGYEVRLVTIHRLDYNETVQSFTDKLFSRWFPEPDDQQNQVLLVLDNVTNTAGIRTGARVKTLMPDDVATSVAQESILIPLKEGNKYNQAMMGAGDRIVAILSGEADPGAPKLKDDVMVEGTFASKEETKQSNATIWVIGFLIAATIIPMATYYFYQYIGSR